ncbi:FAD-binding oxidoreductase, partial [candidate division KSB1 bacterium]
LSGGCLPVRGGIVISLTRMTRIHEIDLNNRYAVVEPGVINQWISEEVKNAGLHFAPDPSSGHACTIGGNVAENAGGPHTLKYGVTVNNVLALEVVMPDGKIVNYGSCFPETPGYDITGILNGSEGTFAIVTKITVKLTPLPESYLTFCAIYDSVEQATKSISGILSAGIVPAAMELIDNVFIKALNEAFDMKFPEDAAAIMIIELDGQEAGMDALGQRVRKISESFGVRSIEAANNEEQRLKLWSARKLAFGAVGRLSPNYYTYDCVVPRKSLPDILARIYEIGKQHNIKIANSFHAGDGNLHPLMMYDERISGDRENVVKAGGKILKACLELGGTISGEHGIGSEKNNYMSLLFNEDDLKFMVDLKNVFDPNEILNPGKIFPDK